MELTTQKRNDSRSGSKRIAGLAATLLLITAGGISLSAHAASFKCGKHSSYSELQVCNNDALSKLDDKLAIDYKKALDVAPDKQSLADNRDQQWKWRQANCHDTACVQNWYERRISELEADYKVGQHAQGVAFETNLDRQKLAPSAAAAVRSMKTDVPTGQLAETSLERVRTMRLATPMQPAAAAAKPAIAVNVSDVSPRAASEHVAPRKAVAHPTDKAASVTASVKTSASSADATTVAQSANAPLKMAPAATTPATTTEAAVTTQKAVH